jgi:hypothetical protein
VTYVRVLDWKTVFADTLFIHLVTIINHSVIAIPHFTVHRYTQVSSVFTGLCCNCQLDSILCCHCQLRNSAQFCAATANSTQFCAATANSTQFCAPTANSTQFCAVTANSTQFCAATANSTQFCAATANSTQFCAATANTGLDSILILVKVKVTLRLAVYRKSVHLGAKPFETHGQRFLSTEPLG